MIRKYHYHMPQTKPRHREEESQIINSNKTSEKTIKQYNLLSLPRQDGCKMFVIFVFIFKFCKSLYVFSWSVKASVAGVHYGLSRMISRFFPVCHVLLGPLMFCYVPTKFCYVYRVLSRFSTMKRGRWFVFEPVCVHSIKMKPTKLLQSLYSKHLVRKHHLCR